MAHCFQCGTYLPPTATHFRRKVHTGSSSGGWVSARSVGRSARSYYGMRSLCAGCADAHDRAVRIKVWVLVSGLALLVMMAMLQAPHTNRARTSKGPIGGGLTTTVAANIREGPSSDSAVAATSKAGERFIIMSAQGNWYRVARPESPNTPLGFVHRSVVSLRN
jgi:uncharacterized protein YgiM (DUF1202 family)